MLARSTFSLPYQDHHHRQNHHHHHRLPSPPPRATAFSALSSFPSFLSYELISLFVFFFVKNLVLILSLSLDVPFLLLLPSLGSSASISSTRLSLPRSSSFRSSRVNLVPSSLLSSTAKRPQFAWSIPDPSHRRTPFSFYSLFFSSRDQNRRATGGLLFIGGKKRTAGDKGHEGRARTPANSRR